jgi:hypothetical protein
MPKKDKDYEAFKKYKAKTKKDKQGRSTNPNSVTQVGGALVTDTAFSAQPINTNRFALNAVTETTSGDLGFTSNERGNVVCSELPEIYNDYIVTGHINLLNDEVILFLATKEEDGFSFIVKQTRDCQIEVLIKSRCLKFLTTKHIKGRWRLLNGCDIVIYFVDGINTDKAINLGSLTNYTEIDPNGDPFSAADANASDLWNCGLMKLEADYLHPCIKLEQVNPTGGNLEIGMYQFAIQYTDSDQNVSNYTYISDNIPISESANTSNSVEAYNTIEGGDPTLETPTNNSISITLDDLDTTYPFFNLAVIETISGISIPYKIETLSTSGSTISYTYRGTTDSSIVLLDSDLTISKVTYESSESIEIAENRLLRANLKEKNIQWGVFQQQANLISSTYFTKPLWWAKGNVYKGAKDANTYFDTKSYMRDEVYAFGIVWVFTDGTESPSFHIPGREKDKFAGGTVIPHLIDPNTHHNRFGLMLGNDWDSAPFTDPHDDTSILTSDERWQVYNTAIREFPSATGENLTNINEASKDREHNPIYDFTRGQLAYFESERVYGNEECDGKRIYPEGNIRFHKMPDTTLEPHFKTIARTSGVYGDYNDQYTLQLGLDFANINPPAKYADEIQGYYIVRSLRDGSNKTIVDKGLIYHNVKNHYDFTGTNKSQQDITYTKLDAPYAANHFTDETWTLEPYAFHTQTCLGNRHWYADYIESSSFFPLMDSTNLMEDTSLYSDRQWGAYLGKVAATNFSDNDSIDVMTQYYDVNNVSFHSPKSKFTPQDMYGGYLKVETRLDGKYVGLRAQRSDGADKKRMSHQVIDYIWMDSNRTYLTNFLIDQTFFVEPHANATRGGVNFVNKQQQETFVIQTNNNNPLPHFDRSAERTIEHSQEDGSTDGTDLDHNSTCLYASLKIDNPAIYGPLYNINYIKASQCIQTGTSNRTFGGDTFISKFSFLKSYTSYQLHDTGDETLWKQLPYYFVESEINTELRHEYRETNLTAEEIDAYFPCTTYYPKETADNYLREKDFSKYTATSWSTATASDLQLVIDEYTSNNYCKNFYEYNSDFSRENITKTYFPLTQGYKWCTNCNNHYPHRVVYSQVGYQEQSVDYFKTFLANSYEDLEGTNGSITDIWSYRDVFYTHTTQSLLARSLQLQQLETVDGELINLGDASLFGSPIKEMNTVDTGFAGNQHKQALAITEAGAFFPDAKAGKIFLLSDTLHELSAKGERNFFEENLPISFLDQFYALTGNEYPFESTTSNMSVGLQSTFDTRHKRWILTKKDFEYYGETLTFNKMDTLQNLYEDIENGNVPFDELIFNPLLFDTFFFVTGDTYTFEITEGIDFTNVEWFKNSSWTKSFCTLIDGWKSYHSYLPNYIYNTQSSLFSSLATSDSIWEHNIGEFQTYYGVKHPFIVEAVATLDTLNTYTTPAISYLANVLEFNSNSKEWLEIDFDTFNKGVFYSTNQSSGMVDLTIKNNSNPFASITNTPGAILVNKEEKSWNVNNIRNNVIDSTETLFTKEWAAIQTDYFIDKVVNSNAIDINKTLFTTDKLRDKFMACRFVYDNPNNRKFNFKYLIDKSKISAR